MTFEIFKEIDQYLEDRLLAEDAVLDGVAEFSDRAGLLPIAVSPLMGAFLQVLAKSVKAKRILEVGALGGYSTIWLGRALPDDGELITMEIDPPAHEVATQSIEVAGLGDRVSVLHGRAADLMAEMIEARAEPFDFIFVDADKPGYPQYLDLCLKLSRPGTLIVFDNIVRGARIVDPANDELGVIGIRTLLDKLGATEGITVSGLQMVGKKGHDGFAVVLVE